MVIAPVLAQQSLTLHIPMAPRANQGHISLPQDHRLPSTGESGEKMPDRKTNIRPHVNHDQRFGHDRPGDSRFQAEPPLIQIISSGTYFTTLARDTMCMLDIEGCSEYSISWRLSGTN